MHSLSDLFPVNLKHKTTANHPVTAVLSSGTGGRGSSLHLLSSTLPLCLCTLHLVTRKHLWSAQSGREGPSLNTSGIVLFLKITALHRALTQDMLYENSLEKPKDYKGLEAERKEENYSWSFPFWGWGVAAQHREASNSCPYCFGLLSVEIIRSQHHS